MNAEKMAIYIFAKLYRVDQAKVSFLLQLEYWFAMFCAPASAIRKTISVLLSARTQDETMYVKPRNHLERCLIVCATAFSQYQHWLLYAV